MTPPESGGLLACGRPADDALNQVADGNGDRRDAHQRQCLHCQAALGEYERLWEPLRELAAERPTAPDSVLDAALARIRGAMSSPDYAVLESPDGVTRISARVVVVTARESAQRVPGVRVALGKHVAAAAHRAVAGEPLATAGAEVSAGVAGRSTAIEITLAADYGQNLPELAERVRAEVSDRIRTLTELEPVAITVVIDDVLT